MAVPEIVERADPPDELSDEQAIVWRAVIDDKPADWFDAAALPILAQYCRHVVASRRVAALIEDATARDAIDIGELEVLLRMQDKETKAIATSATKLRLTPQALSNHRGNKSRAPVARPWDT